MSTVYNTDWFLVQPNYRKMELLTPEWPSDIQLEYMQVVAAPFGGPVATIRDPTKVVPVMGNVQDTIRIFDTSGKEMGHILWNHGKLIGMGWSDTEDLICVLENAKVFVFDMFGKEKESYSIGGEASVTKIMEAKVFQTTSGTVIAAKTTSGRIYLKQNSNKTERKLPDISNSNYSCWSIVTEGRKSYCLLGHDREIIKPMFDNPMGNVITNLFENPYDQIIKMSLSYNQQRLALYTNTGLLWLGSVDMKKKYYEFNTGRKDIPLHIEWIMNTHNYDAEAVVISYSHTLLIATRTGKIADAGDYLFEPIICLVPEIDGVRIITQSSHEIIQSLPKCVYNTFYLYSKAPSSCLLMAQKLFDANSCQSEDCMNMCRKNMKLAVKDCIESATYEFCMETQKRLMRAAYFGKGFIPSHNPEKYMRIIKILRVLNTLRDKENAIPLTYNQFCHFDPEVILSRLVFRKRYRVAMQVAKHLNLSESWILEHWAYHKLMNDPNDNEVARIITDNLKNTSVKEISFCKIAEKAHEIGRDKLAMTLLNLEQQTSLHVPLLLKIGEIKLALKYSTESGDTELITSVLLELNKRMILPDVHENIRHYPLALNLYKNLMSQCSRFALFEIYNIENDHKSIAEFHFYNSFDNKGLESYVSLIGNSYEQAKCTEEANLCDETGRFLKLQKEIATQYNNDCINGMSIHDTIMEILKEGNVKEAEKIQSAFKVPKSRFWWMRILVLVEQDNWKELEEFSKRTKSPIGYEPFVVACLEKNNSKEARKYIKRCPNNRKVHWFLRANLHEDAVEFAFKQRDLNSLYELETKIESFHDTILIHKLGSYIAKLEGNR